MVASLQGLLRHVIAATWYSGHVWYMGHVWWCHLRHGSWHSTSIKICFGQFLHGNVPHQTCWTKRNSASWTGSHLKHQIFFERFKQLRLNYLNFKMFNPLQKHYIKQVLKYMGLRKVKWLDIFRDYSDYRDCLGKPSKKVHILGHRAKYGGEGSEKS